MEVAKALIKLKICSARDRCQAHLRYLDKFRPHIYPSRSIQFIVKALEAALRKLENNLNQLEVDPNLHILDKDEIENKIHYHSGKIFHIGLIMALLEGSDITAVPGELTAPIRREIRKFFPDAELIIVASSRLMYSIIEISGHLRELLEVLECDDEARELPSQIFRVEIPKVEFDQALLHCILAHEIGHPLYKQYEIESKGWSVKVSEEKINNLIKQLKAVIESSAGDINQLVLPLNELEIRAFVTSQVNRVIPSWINEIAADLFGMRIFGPAYVLASIHFGLALFLLNDATDTHPPMRFRLAVLMDCLNRNFPFDKMHNETGRFLGLWQKIAIEEVTGMSPVRQIALDTILEEKIVGKIWDLVVRCVPLNECYSLEKYNDEVSKITQLINVLIPPAEWMENGNIKNISIPGILNAGWECYLGEMIEFKKWLPQKDRCTSFTLSLKFNQFLMKSLELNQIKESWDLARNDIEQPKN